MFEALKFPKARRTALKASGISTNNERLQILAEKLENLWTPADIREQFLMSEYYEALLELATTLSKKDQIAKKIFSILRDYAVALKIPKRDKESIGTAKEIRISSSPQFKKFRKAESAVRDLMKSLKRGGDPLLSTAQMLSISSHYLMKTASLFAEAEHNQKRQRGWAQYLIKLSEIIPAELAEKVLLNLYDDLANELLEYTDLPAPKNKDAKKNKHGKKEEEELGIVVIERAERMLTARRKTIAHAFKKYRDECGLHLRRRGRPKKN